VFSAITSTHSVVSSSPPFSSRFGAFIIFATSLLTDSFRSGSSLGSYETSGFWMSVWMTFLSSAWLPSPWPACALLSWRSFPLPAIFPWTPSPTFRSVCPHCRGLRWFSWSHFTSPGAHYI
jgi:hypothetical protein